MAQVIQSSWSLIFYCWEGENTRKVQSSFCIHQTSGVQKRGGTTRKDAKTARHRACYIQCQGIGLNG